jgi:hypothetical protein
MAKSTVAKRKPKSARAVSAVNPLAELKDWALLNHLLRAKQNRTWGLPASGLYGGGCAAGKAAARIYLKILSESPYVRAGGGGLQGIAIDMLSGRSTKLQTAAGESLRGQAVGFFCEIDRALKVLMQQCPVEQSFESLTAEIDKGLARTKADDEADAKAGRSRDRREALRRRKERQAKAA